VESDGQEEGLQRIERHPFQDSGRNVEVQFQGTTVTNADTQQDTVQSGVHHVIPTPATAGRHQFTNERLRPGGEIGQGSEVPDPGAGEPTERHADALGGAGPCAAFCRINPRVTGRGFGTPEAYADSRGHINQHEQHLTVKQQS
jgi:hypothetical protein